jgi:hypothetical protein
MAVIHAVRRWIAGIIQNAIQPPQRNLQARLATFHSALSPAPLLTIYNPPLQI